MIDLIQSMILQLRPGGIVLLLLFLVSVAGWTSGLLMLYDEIVRGVYGNRSSSEGKRTSDRSDSLDESPRRTILQLDQKGRKRIKRSGVQFVGICATVLPLLGLFGTLLGLIQTFDVLALFERPHIRLLSEGISQALITTQAGLLLALPTLFLYRYLQSSLNFSELGQSKTR